MLIFSVYRLLIHNIHQRSNSFLCLGIKMRSVDKFFLLIVQKCPRTDGYHQHQVQIFQVEKCCVYVGISLHTLAHYLIAAVILVGYYIF